MGVIIRIPTWTTFNRIPAGTPAAGLAALNAALGLSGENSLVEGSPNPVWADLQDLDLGGGPLTRGSTLESLAEVTPIANTSFLTLAQVQLAVAVGGDVEGMQVYFEVADITDEVPVSFPNRTRQIYDEEGNVTGEEVHTWQTWYDGPMPNDYPLEIDGTHYCANYNAWNGGRPLKASEWVPAGLTVRTVAEVQALQQAPA